MIRSYNVGVWLRIQNHSFVLLNVSFDRVWHEITELGVPPSDFLVGPDLVDLGACTAVVGDRLVSLGPARILRQD